jgi:hypothetical protein
MAYLDITNEMLAVDTKKRNFYDNIPEEEIKHFSGFVMMKWAANVDASPAIQEYYLRSANINANINMFNLKNYPKLQWLCLSTVSPGIGKFRHNWFPVKKKEAAEKVSKSAPSAKKVLMELYPHYKEDDIDLMVKFITKEELNAIIRDHGNGK